MAAKTTVLPAGVTIVRVWPEGGVNGKDRVGMIARITGDSDTYTVGSVANPIPASAFGLSKVEDVSHANYDNAKIIPAVPSLDRTGILLADAASGTQANHMNPANFTIADTKILQLEIHGYR